MIFDRHRSTFILWGLKARFIHVLDGKTRNTDFQKVTSFSASRESQRILRKTQFESSNNDRTFVFHKKTSNQKIQIGKKTWKLWISDKNFLPFPTTKKKGCWELLLIPLIRKEAPGGVAKTPWPAALANALVGNAGVPCWLSCWQRWHCPWCRIRKASAKKSNNYLENHPQEVTHTVVSNSQFIKNLDG